MTPGGYGRDVVERVTSSVLADSLVFSELLLEHCTVDQALFDAFMNRRFDRVRAVVEGSKQLVRWEMGPGPEATRAGSWEE